jgi:hypothetical protein
VQLPSVHLCLGESSDDAVAKHSNRLLVRLGNQLVHVGPFVASEIEAEVTVTASAAAEEVPLRWVESDRAAAKIRRRFPSTSQCGSVEGLHVKRRWLWAGQRAGGKHCRNPRCHGPRWPFGWHRGHRRKKATSGSRPCPALQRLPVRRPRCPPNAPGAYKLADGPGRQQQQPEKRQCPAYC